MVTLSLGNKKKSYRSIKLAAAAFNKPYITVYMRMRAGVPVTKALTMSVRKYKKSA